MPSQKLKSLQLQVYGTVPAQRGPVVLATDGATGPKRISGGFLATSGHYGVRAHPYPADLSGPSRSTIAELRAILWGLEEVTRQHTGPITILTDSTVAIQYLTKWAKGGTELPEGYRTWRYSGNSSALEQLQALVANTAGLTFEHEKGHAGHTLNETADSLAKLGLRCSRGLVPKENVPEIAELWARRALENFKVTRR